MATAKEIKSALTFLGEKGAKYVSFRFTDMRGGEHHIDYSLVAVDEDLLSDGIMFDGSSIAGWKAINESDMIIMPDLSTLKLDPFAAQPTAMVMCDVLDPMTGKNYDRDPRSIAKAAEAHLKKTKLADTAFFGPEAEFFVFDDVKFTVGMEEVSYKLESRESPSASGKSYEDGNMGHRPTIKGGYMPVAPVDSGTDLRAEMLTIMEEVGLKVEKHHHEVATSQHELGIKFDTLVNCADHMQLYKYVVKNVAQAYGKTATFMPKPMYGDNGSGMHCHQSLWKDGKPLFAGNDECGLSKNALYYIGGIIKHAKALNAFTNPTTNSYKRLVPGYEAPVLLAYSLRNRSASCRIPYANNPKAKRVEVRFPDPTACSYLAFAAMLMAGLDGIKNKIDPGKPMDKNLYELPPKELAKVPNVAGSLREALNALERDHAFLLEGGVFSKDMIDAYLTLKWDECLAYETMPHPIEYKMYYSA
jgi:glutamine synthetase